MEKIILRRAAKDYSFELELTGRSHPPSEISRSKKDTIERANEKRRQKFCYHHHIEDPTKGIYDRRPLIYQ